MILWMLLWWQVMMGLKWGLPASLVRLMVGMEDRAFVVRVRLMLLRFLSMLQNFLFGSRDDLDTQGQAAMLLTALVLVTLF